MKKFALDVNVLNPKYNCQMKESLISMEFKTKQQTKILCKMMLQFHFLNNFSKDKMPQFWLMVKQAAAKPKQWGLTFPHHKIVIVVLNQE